MEEKIVLASTRGNTVLRAAGLWADTGLKIFCKPLQTRTMAPPPSPTPPPPPPEKKP